MSSLFVNVLTNSSAIIKYKTTPPEIKYLFTTGIETCIVIVAKGDEGIALVHDGGALSEESILKVFRQIGKIQRWHLVDNPNGEQMFKEYNADRYEQKYGQLGIYATKFPRIKQIMERIISPESMPERYPAGQGYVWVTRNGDISGHVVLPCPNPFDQPNLKLINAILELNCAYTNKTTGTLDCHLQYDGVKLTDLPQLVQNFRTIKKKAQDNEHVNNFFQKFIAAKLKHLIRLYDSTSKEHALRNAVNIGKIDDVLFLIKEAQADVNARGKTSGSPLEIARRGNHQKIAELLIEFGAKE